MWERLTHLSPQHPPLLGNLKALEQVEFSRRAYTRRAVANLHSCCGFDRKGERGDVRLAHTHTHTKEQKDSGGGGEKTTAAASCLSKKQLQAFLHPADGGAGRSLLLHSLFISDPHLKLTGVLVVGGMEDIHY